MKQTKRGGFWGGEEFHAKRERVVMKLLTGRASAARLQYLLRGEGSCPDELGQLAGQIARSFSETISEMGSWLGSLPAATVDCGGKKGPTMVKERRGCYKRRRTSDSWIEESPTTEDGFAWRKYGQKEIMNSNYPRCYYRCTHKHEGCKATKQVQMIKDDPITYQTTYFNRHICREQSNQHVTVCSDPVDSNLICFDLNNIQPKQDNHSLISTVIPQVKQEANNKDHHTQSDDQDLNSDEVKSTLQDPWQDIDSGLEPLGYKPDCGMGSLHELDEEVNQLGDIDYSWYMD
ncbi:WRKY DNA-binding protein 70 [Striga asiatica]|uniref:WRKY DNA-binding protein 70 n=1 Tax=Striga asiatica TaxID=4170 RepID=A0A5A7QZL2_STRAF|nr:WRKY DNA-binding protein 70 [Striga asiatica]